MTDDLAAEGDRLQTVLRNLAAVDELKHFAFIAPDLRAAADLIAAALRERDHNAHCLRKGAAAYYVLLAERDALRVQADTAKALADDAIQLLVEGEHHPMSDEVQALVRRYDAAAVEARQCVTGAHPPARD